MRNALTLLLSSVAFLGFAEIGSAQRDIDADPAHHTLEFENNCVRVVRANFGPGEKSALFEAKDAVIVSLRGSQGFKLTFPDGHSIVTPPKNTGDVFWAPGVRAQHENIGDTRVEFLVIEPKGCH
jgi:hypothetical protein